MKKTTKLGFLVLTLTFVFAFVSCDKNDNYETVKIEKKKVEIPPNG